MGKVKFNDELKGRIKGLLGLRWSFSSIQKELKSEGILISKGKLSNIKNQQPLPIVTNLLSRNKNKKVGRPRTVSPGDIKKLKMMVNKDNPPSQRYMALKLNKSVKCINYHIHKTLRFKIKNKKQVHVLTEDNIKKRHQRSFKLYLRLNKDQWKNYITSDESLFHVSECNRQTKFHYVKIDEKSKIVKPYFQPKKFGKAVMVWGAISFNGKSKLYFVKPGIKINSEYYINNVLKPFLKEAKVLYPQNDFIFHQDSAPSHASKKTIKFLKDNNIKFITPEEWMPMSPDAAPMDYYIWSHLKRKLKNHKINNIDRLKRVLKLEWNKIPQKTINKVLKSWAKRCRLIYKNKGLNIENFRILN